MSGKSESTHSEVDEAVSERDEALGHNNPTMRGVNRLAVLLCVSALWHRHVESLEGIRAADALKQDLGDSVRPGMRLRDINASRPGFSLEDSHPTTDVALRQKKNSSAGRGVTLVASRWTLRHFPAIGE